MIIGIDPGLTGAVAFLTKGNSLRVHDLPTMLINKRKQIDAEKFHLIVEPYDRDNWKTINVLIEDVAAMPVQGVTSTFRFGYGAGVLFGVLSTISSFNVIKTKPAVWKSALGLTSNKKDSLTLARKLFPEQADLFKRAKDDGRAEAALLAHFGRKYLS